MSCNAVSELTVTLEKLGQGHILPSLTGEVDVNVDHPVVKQLSKLDIAKSLEKFEIALKSTANPVSQDEIKPLANVLQWNMQEKGVQESIRDLGWEALQQGTVAAIILSGGQGSRLGFDGPKGMYDMGLPSGRSIFQIHIDRLMAVRRLAASKFEETVLPSIPVYIMTSEINSNTIKEYFQEQKFFGYPPDDVYFFEQSLEPCVDFNGRIILESSQSLSLAPDGNGGIYNALHRSGAAEDMFKRGVKHLHIYGIDNVLTKSVDPAFIGACIQKNVQVGNKVCWRANKSEKVGVAVDHHGKMLILEYSEISRTLADAVDDTGKLLYGAGNICNHYMRLDFLIEKVFPQLTGIYHLAKKKIPCLDIDSGLEIVPTENNGYKLEMYIFDVFPLADEWLVMEVMREDEFAPVKNAPDNPVDSPTSAKTMITNQCKHWIEACGGTVEGSGVIEISPSLSYEGEGLFDCKGKVITAPCFLE